MHNGRAHPLGALIAEPAAIKSLARKAKCSPEHLRNIRDGRKSASLALAIRLSDLTGLRMDAFLRPEAERS